MNVMCRYHNPGYFIYNGVTLSEKYLILQKLLLQEKTIVKNKN